MQPKDLFFGGGASETMLHPLVAIWMLIAIAFILTLPRKQAIVPFLLAFFMTPLEQVLLLGPLHFPVLRILILAAMGRALVDGGKRTESIFPGKFNRLDKVVVLWIVSTLVIGCLQWMNGQAFIKLAGDFLDSLGGYLAVRYLIPDREAVRRAIGVLAFVCLIQGACMMSEQVTYRNVFDFLGAHEPTIRNGTLRSEGTLGTLFGGTFAGVMIPPFLWLWTQKESKKAGALGLIGATAMMMASHASTSWLAYGSGVLGLCFWPLRRQMRVVRYGIVVTLVGLHLVMHGPVWSLIEKIDLTGGSSSYHRYMLVDNCIRHFSDWWLLGYKYYGDWGFDMWDLCNQFVATALTGGLITLVLFIMIYSRSFGTIGKKVKQVKADRAQAWLLWSLGASLFANVVASFGINYMIELQVMLFVLIASTSIGAFKFGAQGAVEQTPDKSDDALPAPDRKFA
jgi:hypothetical protein